MKKAGLFDKIDPAVWKQQWVIDSQAVGQGQNALRYISRYVFRVAISNNRIKSIENDVIKFLYKDREKKKWKIMLNHTTCGASFIPCLRLSNHIRSDKSSISPNTAVTR